MSLYRGCGGLVVNTSDFGSRGRGFEPHLGRRLLSLSKKGLPPPPSSTGNTGEEVAPFQHATKSKQSMDTYTQEKSSANRDSPLNSVLHKSDCN